MFTAFLLLLSLLLPLTWGAARLLRARRPQPAFHPAPEIPLLPAPQPKPETKQATPKRRRDPEIAKNFADLKAMIAENDRWLRQFHREQRQRRKQEREQRRALRRTRPPMPSPPSSERPAAPPEPQAPSLPAPTPSIPTPPSPAPPVAPSVEIQIENQFDKPAETPAPTPLSQTAEIAPAPPETPHQPTSRWRSLPRAAIHLTARTIHRAAIYLLRPIARSIRWLSALFH